MLDSYMLTKIKIYHIGTFYTHSKNSCKDFDSKIYNKINHQSEN